METNNIKKLAREARIMLREAVGKQLLYWGVNANGDIVEKPTPVSGGYLYREQVFTDTTVLGKWEKLVAKVQEGKEGVNDVKEEAAYTWFNRLMAIKILEENSFIEPVLQFEPGSNVPVILQQAKAGIHQVTHSVAKSNLQAALMENKDEVAFGVLIVEYCRKHPLLKSVFGHVNDYTELLLPTDLLISGGLIELLNADANVQKSEYKEVELIGWLYQFYISDKKDEVFKGFKANKKARAQDIPAATQIFTPKWIVKYMVENTVGKNYLAYESDSVLKGEMNYLVENEGEIAEAIIEDITELTLLDPACGSGHILVTGFELLYKMYREQGYNAKNAVESILKNNLYGLDIDDRAMQLARFAVLLKAGQQLEEASQGQGKIFLNNEVLTIPHIYAFAEERDFTSEEISDFTAGKCVAEIYKAIDTLRQGKNIGSALKLHLSEEAIEVIGAQYIIWKEREREGSLDMIQLELWEPLQAYVELLMVMTKKYAAVVANPPYMGQKSMNAQLKDYVNKEYPMTKSDLFAVFMEVCLSMTSKKGLMGMINQHSWMFLSSYEKYREYLLLNESIISMLHLGPRTFEELSGEVVQSTSFVLKHDIPKEVKGAYHRLVDYKSNVEKEEHFLKGSDFYPNISQTNFDKIPGSPIAYWVSERVLGWFKKDKTIKDFADCKSGMSTSDNKRFTRNWNELEFSKLGFKLKNATEVIESKRRWLPYNKGGNYRKWYGNLELVVNWYNDGEDIKKAVVSNPNDPDTTHWSRRIYNTEYFFLEGATWSKIGASGFTIRYLPLGCISDVGGCCLYVINKDENNLFSIIGLLNSKLSDVFVKEISPTLNYEIYQIANVPLSKIEKDSIINDFVDNNICISKKDWDSRETSWDFEGNPLLEDSTLSLEKAYEGWKEDVSKDFFKLHTNEEELNSIFIDIYELQEELTPKVPLKEITILQDELKASDLEEIEPAFRAGETVELPIQSEVVMSQFISYLIGVTMGRYRLDKKGLHIAHPNPTEEEIAAYEVSNAVEPFMMTIDEDAILPIMGDNCAFANDAVKRVKDLIYKIWGNEAVVDNLNFINACLQMDMGQWIADKFWSYHISGTMYKKKPIYWMFCSNVKAPHKSAFKVLVYMHRMNQYTVTNIMRKYLYPHQEYLEALHKDLSDRESELNKQELKKKELLAKQIVEVKEYYEVLKGLSDLEITFDLDDGVTVNYAKFEGGVAIIK